MNLNIQDSLGIFKISKKQWSIIHKKIKDKKTRLIFKT